MKKLMLAAALLAGFAFVNAEESADDAASTKEDIEAVLRQVNTEVSDGAESIKEAASEATRAIAEKAADAAAAIKEAASEAATEDEAK